MREPVAEPEVGPPAAEDQGIEVATDAEVEGDGPADVEMVGEPVEEAPEAAIAESEEQEVHVPEPTMPGDSAVVGGRVVDVRNPTAEDAAVAPAVKPRPVKIEQAGRDELVAGIASMWDSDNEETNLLYQDGAPGDSKMARAIAKLVEVLLFDEGRTDWERFVAGVRESPWPDHLRARAVRAASEWYEMGREAGVPDMTPVDEVQAWYTERDELGEPRARPAEGREPVDEGRPAAGRRAEGLRDGRSQADEAVVRDRDSERDQPEPESRREGSGDRPGEGGDRTRRTDPADSPVGDWRFAPGALNATEARGPTQKARDNVAAIELLQQLQTEGRKATRREQAILAQYVGWGGLSGAFPNPSTGRFNRGFEEVGARLQEILPEDQYNAARQSIQFAHYTSEPVISSMWDAVRSMGFGGGRVMEPGAGLAHFAGMMPGDLAGRSSYMGIELDATTAGIAAQLYPERSIRQQDFVRTPAPPMFDLVIGNPPFAQTRVLSDPKYADQRFVLHDYFFAKSVDALRPWRRHGVRHQRWHHEQGRSEGASVPRRSRRLPGRVSATQHSLQGERRHRGYDRRAVLPPAAERRRVEPRGAVGGHRDGRDAHP